MDVGILETSTIRETMPTCTRTGCGKIFDENDSNAGDCQFHPGGTSPYKYEINGTAPIFHEGLKG